MPSPADLTSLPVPYFEDRTGAGFVKAAGTELDTMAHSVRAAMIDLRREFNQCMLRPAAHAGPDPFFPPIVLSDKELLAFAVKFKVMQALAKGLFASAKAHTADGTRQASVVQSIQRDLATLQGDIARIRGKTPVNGVMRASSGVASSPVKPSMQGTRIGATSFRRPG